MLLHMGLSSHLVLGIFSLLFLVFLLASLHKLFRTIDDSIASALDAIAQRGVFVLGHLSVGLSLSLVAFFLGLVLSLLGGGTKIFSGSLGGFSDPVSGLLEDSLFVISAHVVV